MLPMLSLERARPLLKNPDRGLRMETCLTPKPDGTPECCPGSREDPYKKLRGLSEKYTDESPMLAQLYIYLTHYNKRGLDAAAFAQMRQMLELLRELGVRALLRFAYQTEAYPDAGWRRVKGHLEQIGQWFQSNGPLLEDTMFAVQAGIVGCWGEGHSFVRFKEQHIGPAYDLLLRIVPEDMYVQVRTSALYNRVSKQYAERLGMHDDYLIGEKRGEWSFFLGEQNEHTKRLEEWFRRTINDAELPWGRAAYYDQPDGHPLDSLDAMQIFAQCAQYSLTSLSLEHNYRESPEHVYSMARWKEEMLTAKQLDEAGLPYHSGLLDPKGCISAFAYIQYHLGYLLSIPSFDIAPGKARFTIRNNGFAAPLSLNALSLIVDGKEYFVESYDKYALGSMQAVTYTMALPDLRGARRIGVKLARRAGSPIAARFMNDAEFSHGVQMIM